MASNGNRINYTIGFNVDKAGIEQIKNELNQLSNMTKQDFMKINPGSSIQQINTSFKQVQGTINEVKNAYNSAFSSQTGVTNLNKLASSLNKIGFNKIAADFKQLGVQGVQTFNNMTRQVYSTNLKFKETNNLLDKMSKTLGNTVKWSIASSAVNNFTGAIQQAFGYVQHLDKSLNDIRIVTGKSAEEMDQFAIKANEAAKALGASTTEYTEAALIYRQQGLGDEETQARTETTLKAANVTGQTGRQVSEELTAVWNGYKVTAEETEQYVDKLAAVAATTASNLEELSTGMSKVASAANNMGVNVDQLNGMLATIISVTRQAPETAGTALKTIFARMEDLKISGEDEYGVKLGQVSGTLNEVGIQIMDTAGNMRDLGEVIEEVGNKWDGWTRAQQSAIAQSIAGKRQYNNLLALFDNWNMYNKAVATSENSLGTLQKQQDIYMESTEAHLQQLKTEWEDLYDSILDVKDINELVDAFSALLDKFTLFIDAIGGGKGALLGFSAVAMNVFNKQISIGLSDTIQKFINAKDNAKLLNDEVERIAQTKGIDKTTQAFQVLYELKNQKFGYMDLMSDEEIQDLDNAIEKVVDIYAEVDRLEAKEEERLKTIREQIKAEEELVQKLALAQVGPNGRALPGSGGKAAQNIDIEAGKGVDEAQKTLEYADQLLKKNGEVEQSWKELEAVLEEYKEKAIEVNKVQNEINQTPQNKITKGKLDELHQLEKQMVTLQNKVAPLVKELEQLFEQSGISDNLTKRLLGVFNAFKNFAQGGKSTSGITNAINAFEKELPGAIQKSKKEIKDAQKEIPKLSEGIHETAEKAKKDIDNVTAEAQQAKNNLQQSFKTLDLRETVSSITSFSQGLTNIAFAMQSIQNLGSIWRNEDVSLGDKITQTLMSMSMVITNLIYGISALKKSFPEIITLFKQFPQLLNTINTGLIKYALGTSSVAAAKKFLAQMTEDEVKALAKAIGLETLDIETLNEQDAALVLNAAFKKDNAFATEILGDKSLFAAAASKALGAALTFLTSPIGIAVAALVALTAVVTAVDSHYAKLKKRAAEVAKEQVESSEKIVEANKQHLESVKQLKQEYENIKGSYSADNVEELRKKVYDLCQQYGVQIDMLQLMTATYAELDNIINQVNNDALKQTNEALFDNINKQLEYMKTNAKSIEAETVGPLNHVFLILQKIDQLGTPLIDNLTNFNKFNLNISKVFGEGENISNIISTDFEGAISINWDEYYKASEETQKQVEEYLEKTYESFAGDIYSFFDKSGQAALKAIRENKENQDKIKELQEEYKQSKIDEIYDVEFDNIDITTAGGYNKTKNDLAERIKDELQLTIEEALELAEQKLAATDNAYNIKSSITVGQQLAVKYKGQTPEEIADQYNKQTSATKSFISSNLDLASTYESLDDFIDAYHDIIDKENQNQRIINVGVALTNSDGKAFKQEDIDALFNTEGFSIGKTQEEFQSQTYEKQVADLTQYYMKANQLENDFQNTKLKDLEEEQTKKKESLEAQAQELETIKNQAISKYSDISEDDLFVGIYDNYKSQLEDIKSLMNENAGFEIISEDGYDILKKYVEGVKDLTYEEQDYIAYLKEKNNYSDEDLTHMYHQIDAYEDYNKLISQSSEDLQKAIKGCYSYTNATKKLGAQLRQTEGVLDDLGEADIDWSAAKQSIETLKEYTNSTIDSLQGAYSSLTSVMEEYNSTQVLSMDNLQTLLNMDTQYLAALELENGQMTLNEEALKQIALAKLDEAEAEAYAQAMEELHNEETRQAVLQSQQAVISLNSLGGAATSAAEAARGGIDAWKAYWDAALNREGVANDAYSQQVGDALRNKLQAIDQVRQQIMSGNFGATMKGPSSSSGSSSSSAKEAKHEDYLEREVDLYREVNAQLKQIESTLSRIQKQNNYKWGKDLQKGLERENKLLDKQLDKLKEKKKIQEKDIAQQRANLEQEGIKFSKDGSSMSNTESKLNELYSTYNSMVDKYNSMTADQQESYKETLDKQKEYIDKIEKAIDKYESSFSDYQSTLDQLLELHYQQIENAVNRFNNMVDVHLELDEARKEWSDFWFEVVEDVDDTDFAGKIAQSISKLQTLIGFGDKAAQSTISVLTEHLNATVDEVQQQIASRKRGGEDSLFGDATKLSKENLEKYRDQLMDALREAKEEVDNISENYLKMLDSAQEKIDKQVEGWESIGDHLEHNVELIKLLDGEDAYNALTKQYDKIYDNDKELLLTQRQSQEFWKDQIKRYEDLLKVTDKSSVQWKTYSEGLEKASENYKKAVADLDKTIEKAIKDLQTWRENQVNSIIDTLDKAMSGGLGVDLVEQEWELITDLSSKYLDNVERAYSMEEYALDLEDAANAIGLSAENQEKLNKFRDEELRKLNEKEKLTQYDIDESRARLEIMKQEMALEEARENKSNMRLRRDSQGNYTYQYVGSEEDENAGERGVLTAKREWYELVKKRYKEASDWIIELQKQQTTLHKEIADAEAVGDTERANKLRELYEINAKAIQDAYAEAGKNVQDIYSGVAQYFSNVNNATILPESKATVRTLIDEWAGGGEQSFTGAVNKAITDLQGVQEEYASRTKEILELAGVEYKELAENGIDPTTESLKELVDTNEELHEQLDEINQQLDDEEKLLQAVEAAYDSLKDAAVDALEAANNALETLAQTAIDTQRDVAAAVAAAQAAANASSAPSSGPGGGGPSSSGTNNSTSGHKPKSGVTLVRNTYGQYELQYNGKRVLEEFFGGTGSSNTAKDAMDYFYKKAPGYFEYKTGGYTGSWNVGMPGTNNGKLAILHQKELVLNETDTSNLLKAVYTLREMVAAKTNTSGIADQLVAAGNMQAQILAQVGTGILSSLASITTENANTSYRNMTVNADFSGVRSADAIYQALMELENYGMQNSYSVAPHMNTSF